MKKLEEMTRNEKMVRRIIIGLRNEYVGGFENMLLDYGEDGMKEMGYTLPTREEVIEYIYNEIMGGNDDYIYCPNECWGIEKKHIKFMGEKFIRELIEDRVDHDINKNGWAWL